VKSIHHLLFILFSVFWANAALAEFTQQTNVRAFIAKMHEQHQFDKTQLENLFKQIKLRPEVIQQMQKPAEGKPWYKYRPLFVNDRNIRQGKAFMKKHHVWLKKAQESTGVPAEIMTAILGIESRYGANTGKHRVLDTLATFAFSPTRRSRFFRKELIQFLLMTRAEKQNPLTLHGSYAGAMGMAQFMPSSFQQYAIDFDHSGTRDLNTVPDAIGSIANYFQKHHWKSGHPVANPMTAYYPRTEKNIRHLLDYQVTPTPQHKVTLVSLETPEDFEHWLVYQNFYVITRYNHSALYAMAVFQLAEAIKSHD